MKCKTCKQEIPTRFPDGVDWHIVGKSCRCMYETLPVADNASEDIFLFELLEKYRGKKCSDCNTYFKLVVEDGNMASKRKEIKTT